MVASQYSVTLYAIAPRSALTAAQCIFFKIVAFLVLRLGSTTDLRVQWGKAMLLDGVKHNYVINQTALSTWAEIAGSPETAFTIYFKTSPMTSQPKNQIS